MPSVHTYQPKLHNSASSTHCSFQEGWWCLARTCMELPWRPSSLGLSTVPAYLMHNFQHHPSNCEICLGIHVQLLALEVARFEVSIEEVWYAEASACFICWNGIGVVSETLGVGGTVREIDAVAIDNWDWMRSNGYIKPIKHDKIVNANGEIMMKYVDSQKEDKCLKMYRQGWY